MLNALWVVPVLAVWLYMLPAHAQPPEIYPLEKVRRGQQGYGLTTMQGTTPERFSFEVVGVTRNFLPKMDIILVKSDDPKLAVTGFWRGMSGSPLFIEGKLACAFSYGFRFNKVALGGCTPIHYMKQEGFLPPRRLPGQDEGTDLRPAARGQTPGRAATASRSSDARPGSAHRNSRSFPGAGASPGPASMNDWLRLAPERTVASAMQTLGTPRKPWLMRAPLPRAPARVVDDGSGGMVAAAVPLALSGVSAPAFAVVQQLFGSYPVEPMRAGGTGSPDQGPARFQLGGAIGVQLIRGDMSAAATGTVSYVDGNRVLGFGHPLFQAGELYAPVAAAEIHAVIPSAQSAFIVASPLRELGSLVQDRQSTIMADTNLDTRMIPVDIYVETQRGGQVAHDEFHVEVINNRFMTGTFAGVAALSAVSHYLPDRDHATVYMESSVFVHGYEPLHFVDYLYAEDGAGTAIGGARGLRALVVLLNNPFAPVSIERVELRTRIHYQANYGEIQELRLPAAELPPGRRTHVDVVMSTYDGKDIVTRVPFDVPAHLAGSIVKLEVSAGDAASVEAAPPRNLDELMAVIRKLLPGNVLAVTLYSADQGVAIDGKLVRDLPASALDRLHPGSGTQRAEGYHPMARSIYPARRVIQGSESTLVKVADQ